MNPFVQVQNVSKSFATKAGPYVAVRDINLSVAQGEFVALIGHSGCGKSTVLNMIAGLYAPSNGSVRVDGREIKGPGPDRAMVFQNYSLLPWLSVAENVFQAVDSVYEKNLTRVQKREMADHFIEMVGLAKHRDKLPGQLSGGMKQRAAIARAFATKPEVLLLDEPFGALDALTKSALHDELLAIWNESARGDRAQTIFMVTHDIDEAIYLCDRIVVFSNGPAATVAEIIEVPIPRPRDKRTIAQLSAYGEIKGRLIDLLSVGSLGSARHKRDDNPKRVRVGFMPLTDCAPLVMAKELELDFKHGIEIELVKDSSWMSVRDNLISNEVDAAHCLWSLPLALAVGAAPPRGALLPIALTMASNGQGITLSPTIFPIEPGDLDGLRAAVELERTRRGEPLAFAATFAGGTHDLWLRTLLDEAGVSPEDYRIVTIPPPQMVINLQNGSIDGFAAGEPWNALAVARSAGFSFLNSASIWRDHPEKALVLAPGVLEARRDAVKALMKAVIEAALWLDEPKNLDRAAQKLASPRYVGAADENIWGRLEGHFETGSGRGEKYEPAAQVAFARGGSLTMPRLDHARWFTDRLASPTFGVQGEVDADEIAARLVQIDLYREVVLELNEQGHTLPLPEAENLAPIELFPERAPALLTR